MKFLFVGGIANGLMIDVDPIRQDPEVYPETYSIHKEVAPNFEYTTRPVTSQINEQSVQHYRRADLYSGRTLYHVYTIGNPQNIIEDLIRGYADFRMHRGLVQVIADRLDNDEIL